MGRGSKAELEAVVCCVDDRPDDRPRGRLRLLGFAGPPFLRLCLQRLFFYRFFFLLRRRQLSGRLGGAQRHAEDDAERQHP